MTNYDKYKHEIKNSIENGTLGDWCWEKGIYMLSDTSLYSAIKVSMWLMEEYNGEQIMTKDEARKILLSVANDLGTTSIECYSEKDGNKMRDAIDVLYYS